jgi:hypothetical protein
MEERLALVVEHVLSRLCRCRPWELLTRRPTRRNLALARWSTVQAPTALAIPTARAANRLAGVAWCADALPILTHNAVEALTALVSTKGEAADATSS